MTIRKRTVVFAAVMLVIIFFAGLATYLALNQTLSSNNWAQELASISEEKKLTLETSVKNDIVLALKWADSPLTKTFFSNPSDKAIEKLAFAEFTGYRSAFSNKSNFWVNDVDKKFYSNDVYSYTVDPENKNDYWYKMTLYETASYNFNINFNENLNETCLWINAPVFNESKPIGIVGTGIVLDNFIQSVYTGLDKNFNIYFFNKNDEITGAADKTIIPKKENIYTYFPQYADSIKKNITSIVIDDTTKQSVAFTTGNSVCYLVYVPTLDWYMFSYISLDYGMIRNKTVRSVFLLIYFTIFVSLSLFAWFVLRITRPLVHLKKTMASVSDGDFTASFDYKRADEIGSLSKGLSRITQTVSRIIGDTHTQFESVHSINTDSQEHLSTCIDETRQIISELGQANSSLTNQFTVIKNTADVTAKNKNDIISFENTISQQITLISDSASKIRQMLECVDKLSTLSHSSTENMSGLSNTSAEGTQKLNAVVTQIDTISSGSAKLLETNKLISSISEQTNLLAMNASIEAAHAGEAGKGFAVVAGEIRSLAEKTRVQSEEVERVIKTIIASVDNVVSFSETTKAVFDKIVTLVSQVNTNFKDLTTVIQTENTLSTDISQQLTSLAESSSSVSGGFNSMKEDTLSISVGMEQAKSQTNDLVVAMGKVASQADAIKTSISEVMNLANKNEEEMRSLDAGLSSYTILNK